MGAPGQADPIRSVPRWRGPRCGRCEPAGGSLLDTAFVESQAGFPWHARNDTTVTEQEADMDIAVLGMGQMGRALAARLLEGGHRVAVWNRSKGKAGEIGRASCRARV